MALFENTKRNLCLQLHINFQIHLMLINKSIQIFVTQQIFYPLEFGIEGPSLKEFAHEFPYAIKSLCLLVYRVKL